MPSFKVYSEVRNLHTDELYHSFECNIEFEKFEIRSNGLPDESAIKFHAMQKFQETCRYQPSIKRRMGTNAWKFEAIIA